MNIHKGRPFSTFDQPGGSECAVKSGGGFWYGQTDPCYTANPTGPLGIPKSNSMKCLGAYIKGNYVCGYNAEMTLKLDFEYGRSLE